MRFLVQATLGNSEARVILVDLLLKDGNVVRRSLQSSLFSQYQHNPQDAAGMPAVLNNNGFVGHSTLLSSQAVDQDGIG